MQQILLKAKDNHCGLFCYFAFLIMTLKQQAYLSLGSNLGERALNLQKAVLEIAKKVGDVTAVSSVYENAAVGFEGGDFLNACIGVQTDLSPSDLLQQILQLEIDFGRERNNKTGYQSRTLDIDILLYGTEVVEGAALTIPHPNMQARTFVLKPLADIAPQLYHPVLNKDIRNL
ncbi:MAG: 2-amino-4-hydroxy-6-hydroxymethyldihydropteridine diphosphokinase, partial [Allomuricauda sp.]